MHKGRVSRAVTLKDSNQFLPFAPSYWVTEYKFRLQLVNKTRLFSESSPTKLLGTWKKGVYIKSVK